jgi:hypothetical protein
MKGNFAAAAQRRGARPAEKEAADREHHEAERIKGDHFTLIAKRSGPANTAEPPPGYEIEFISVRLPSSIEGP